MKDYIESTQHLAEQLAGLRLRDRWGDWTRGEFNGASEKHISVYERGG